MTNADRWVIRSRRVVTPEGTVPAAVLVCGQTIEAVLGHDEAPAEIPRVDAGNRVLMPGIVDSHVHVNEPGRAEWEGFDTATRAAAAGGVTTLMDMPLNSVPVTTTCAALEAKLAAARDRVRVDCGFWGGVVPGNTGELLPMIRAGARGFKAFLIDSGIDEFPAVTERDLREAMRVLARIGVPLLVHAEVTLHEKPPAPQADPRRYASYLDTRPEEMENQAIARLVRLCRETGCPVHIVHLSSAGALPILAEARSEGLPVTVETCPHYLFFTAGEVPDGGTAFKCAPPIRGEENRDQLWDALKNRLIDCVVSDHSPCVPALKLPDTGDFLKAWGGIASVQLGLSVVWTEGRGRDLSFREIARLMCEGPARLAGLSGRKGKIAKGFDADLAVWDPEAFFVVEPSRIFHRHKVTPYLGRALYGSIETTFLRGRKIFDRGEVADPPSGKLVLDHECVYGPG